MESNPRKAIWIFFSILLLVMVAAYAGSVIQRPDSILKKPLGDKQGVQGQYFTVRDESNNIILQTGLPIHINDEYIDENDKHYIINAIRGYEATATIKKSGAPGGAIIKSSIPEIPQVPDKSVPAQVLRPGFHVVIYHTHTDESFVPTSGTSSKPGNGGVFAVGSSLEDELLKNGINVTHSWNRHDPHDINAYHRSRRTVVQLLKQKPDAIFDIHRDAAPVSAYQTSINGIPTSRVMIVVGRSNPNMGANLEYARKIKQTADRLHPGLMRGIFIGKGDYNQDIHPRAVLFEIGTEGNYQLAAERAAKGLADAIIKVLTG